VYLPSVQLDSTKWEEVVPIVGMAVHLTNVLRGSIKTGCHATVAATRIPRLVKHVKLAILVLIVLGHRATVLAIRTPKIVPHVLLVLLETIKVALLAMGLVHRILKHAHLVKNVLGVNLPPEALAMERATATLKFVMRVGMVEQLMLAYPENTNLGALARARVTWTPKNAQLVRK